MGQVLLPEADSALALLALLLLPERSQEDIKASALKVTVRFFYCEICCFACFAVALFTVEPRRALFD